MSAIAESIRKSRERNVPAGGFMFTIRRPTRLALGRWRGREQIDNAIDCVVGWNVKECDLFPGGGGTVPPFDAEAFREWAEDRPEIIRDLIDAVNTMIDEFAKEIEATEGNSSRLSTEQASTTEVEPKS